MLNFGNKEFRNLQEQVLFNANELQALKQLQLGGVKIIDLIEHSEDLPVEATAGDAYLVGQARPYRLYVFIDGDYFDLGDFPQVGPQGIQGIQGIRGKTGQRGSKWSIGTEKPAGLLDDLHIDFNGNIYRFNGDLWELFANIRGPQGLPGPIGPDGPQGEQGIQGEKGDTGLSAPAVVIKGVLTSINQLPSPTVVDRNSAYIINKEIYVLTGESLLLWTSAGLISKYTSADDITFDDRYGGGIQASTVQEAIEQLDDFKVDKFRTINTKPLTSNITLDATDIMAGAKTVGDWIQDLDLDKADKSTTINNKPLSGNITITDSDIFSPGFGDMVDNVLSDLDLEIGGLNSTKADKATTLAGYGITDAYTKSEVDNRTSAVYRHKGNVATYANLPSAGLTVGDVYNVVDTGINYVWNGTAWDDIGGVEALATTSENGLMSKEDFVKLQALDGNLGLKADITYVDDEVEALNDKIDLKVDKITLTNLVGNGDLLTAKPSPNENEPLGFSYSNATNVTLSGGIATFTATSQDGRFETSFPLNAASIIYYFARYKTDSSLVTFTPAGVTIVGTEHSGSNTFETISYVVTQYSDRYPQIRDTRTSGWTPIEVDYMGAINLTATFGAGNEPTKEQMDLLLRYTGFFQNKELNLTDIFKITSRPTQEEWITPTLLNGWATSVERNIEYMKDTLGFVHIKGRITSGTILSPAFILPAGYRPNEIMRIPIISNDLFGIVIINASSGEVVVQKGDNTYVDLYSITFKADA